MMPLLEGAPVQKGMSVIVRADCDTAPVRGRIRDDFRLRALLPTLHLLTRQGARIRIIGHRGRPGGTPDRAMSVAPVGRFLARALGRRVALVADPFLPGAPEKYRERGDVLLLENLRFWPGEEKNDPAFAQALAAWGEIYVNDAFAVCHRAHASMVGLPRLLPAYAGIRLTEEIAALERVVKNPARPLIAVVGGAKIETKLSLIRRFLKDADSVLVGGALANTLFAAGGKNIGKSLAEKEARDALSLLKNKKLILPSDVLTADALEAGAAQYVRLADNVRAGDYIVDIGPASRRLFAAIISEAKTIVWNGPMGFAEVSAYANGTKSIACAMAENHGFTVVGGGDTVAVLSRYHLAVGFSHISTGGGAMLAFLAGEKLPGIEALKYAKGKK